MESVPTDDPTPVRGPDPDHTWFPCPHCGRAIKCPPVAMPVDKDTTALVRRNEPLTDLIIELDPPLA